MAPPEGAWMTRDGDVIEIGCHSGYKTWTLRCDDNKWIGVLGYCGHHTETEIAEHDNDIIQSESGRVWSISLSESFFSFEISSAQAHILITCTILLRSDDMNVRDTQCLQTCLCLA